MKVMLATTAHSFVTERWMPLGICYIAAALQAQGHEVRIFDRYVQAAKYGHSSINEYMCREIREFHPDIVGFNSYTPSIFDTIEAVKAVRTQFKGPLILGGHHATALPVLTLVRIQEADMVLTGEAESSFCKIANSAPRETIPGLYWREGDEIRSGVKAVPVNLDELPLPAYDLLDMDFYTKRNPATIRPFYRSVGSLLSSRGCNNRCTFCTESLTFSGGIRAHSPDYVMENIDVLVKKHKCDGITFLDNNFLADKRRAEDILDRLIAMRRNSDVIYCVQARADDIDADIMKRMREAGVRKVEIGLETFDQRALDRMNKNIRIECSQRAVRICREHGVSVQANLIMGTEGETLSSLNDTLDWLKKLKVDNVKWGMLQLYPGSALYTQKADGYIEKNEWSAKKIRCFYNKDHLSDISPEERSRWRRIKLRPYLKYMHHKGILSCNSLADSLTYYFKRTVRGKRL